MNVKRWQRKLKIRPQILVHINVWPRCDSNSCIQNKAMTIKYYCILSYNIKEMISNNSILTCIDKLHWQYVRMCIVYCVPHKNGSQLNLPNRKNQKPSQVKNLCHLYFCNNCDKFGPIFIILSIFNLRMNCRGSSAQWHSFVCPTWYCLRWTDIQSVNSN